MAVCLHRENQREDFTVYAASLPKSRPISVHQHDYIEIFLNLSSTQTFLINDQMYTVAPHNLIVVDSGESHAVTGADDGYGCFITVRPTFLLALCTEQTNLLPWRSLDGTIRQRHFPLSEEAFDNLSLLVRRCQYGAGGYGGDVLGKVYFIELMVALSAHCRNAEQASGSHAARYAEILAPALRYISQNFHENFSLQEMADSIGVSRCYLCRVFKNGTGVTISQYVMSRRMELAKELLRSGKNVTEVSTTVGFNDYSYLIKSLKSITGITPAKYARAFCV